VLLQRKQPLSLFQHFYPRSATVNHMGTLRRLRSKPASVIAGILIDLFIELLTWIVAGVGQSLGEWLFRKIKKLFKQPRVPADDHAAPRQKPPAKRSPKRRQPPKK
jgi:predicted alpha/beta hydrolase